AILMVVGVTVIVLGLMAALVITAVIFDRNATHRASRAPTTTKVKVPETAQPTEPSANVPPLPAFAAPADLAANSQYPTPPDHAARAATPPRSANVPTDPAVIGPR